MINFEIFLGVGNFVGDLVGFVGNCVGVKRVPDDDIRIAALCNAALPATAADFKLCYSIAAVFMWQ